ncbi:hypothetical protein DQF27_23850, partial [Escherichia coli]|nr:hypothetical protein [Escherichia coli]
HIIIFQKENTVLYPLFLYHLFFSRLSKDKRNIGSYSTPEDFLVITSSMIRRFSRTNKIPVGMNI